MRFLFPPRFVIEGRGRVAGTTKRDRGSKQSRLNVPGGRPAGTTRGQGGGD